MAQLQRDPIVINPEGIKPMYFGQFINNFTNWWNDHDAGRRAWTVMNFGGFRMGTTTQSGDYTLTNTDTVVLVDSTAATRTITLPTAVGQTGRQYVIKVSAGNKIVTVNTTSSQTIDGALTVGLPGFPFSMTVISNGSNWFIL